MAHKSNLEISSNDIAVYIAEYKENIRTKSLKFIWIVLEEAVSEK